MRTVPVLKQIPELQQLWLPLIKEPTPVYALQNFGKTLGQSQLYVKREDLTDSLYGGNKVRNLEFLLGEAVHKKASQILSLAPLGSNFISALSAQASKVGIPVDVYHFKPTVTEQMQRHAEYSRTLGARLVVPGGGYVPSLVRASLKFSKALFEGGKHTYRMPTGGSSALGAIGHLNAFLELLEQIERREIPPPDVLVVGAGTCGTMAGLIAGKVLAGSSIDIIGVRCVDRVICNRWSIAQLANDVLTMAGVAPSVRPWQVQLKEQGSVDYGCPPSEAQDLMKSMWQTEGFLLDTTYTTKVVSYLAQMIRSERYQNKNILYWHTFSGAAMVGSSPATQSVGDSKWLVQRAPISALASLNFRELDNL